MWPVEEPSIFLYKSAKFGWKIRKIVRVYCDREYIHTQNGSFPEKQSQDPN